MTKITQKIMKTLKFAHPLPELILEWEKTTTWRINDDKDFQVWDEVIFYSRETWLEFAQAKIVDVKITTFWKLDENDYNWHEKFESEKEMYATYSKYYNLEVAPETEVKIIKFVLIK